MNLLTALRLLERAAEPNSTRTARPSDLANLTRPMLLRLRTYYDRLRREHPNTEAPPFHKLDDAATFSPSQPESSTITLRVPSPLKSRCVKAAKATNGKLSPWITNALDAQATRDGFPPRP